MGLGAAGGRVSAGDLATSVTTDTDDIGDYPNALARVVAAGVALVVVAVYLLAGSPLLGVVVLVGVPVVMWVTTKVAEPLEDRQREHRGLLGRLGDLGSDIALGLRVLRGIGAERAFRDRYRDVSRRTRAAGIAVAHTQATLEAAKVLLPGIFLVVVTWLGARLAVGGAITAGELVAFFAAAAFLVEPLSSVPGSSPPGARPWWRRTTSCVRWTFRNRWWRADVHQREGTWLTGNWLRRGESSRRW
nr:hypothetical protein GCM10017745_43770 [Saccharothrix mutabilis subsp. capreolus]